MEKCGYCGSTIVIGGARLGGQRFCNSRCQQAAQLLEFARLVPPEVLERQIDEIFRGNCPKCRGLGPIDVHKFYEVWSLLVVTRWATTQQVSCRSCATKRQLGALLFSLFCGWWGFPWGLVLTPIQIVRNLMAMGQRTDPSSPSPLLRKLVQVNLGRQMMAAGQAKASKISPVARNLAPTTA